MLSRRGGLATARRDAANGYSHIKAIARLGRLKRIRLSCIRRIIKLDAYCKLHYSLSLLQMLTTPEGQAILDQGEGGDSPRSGRGK